jgi:CheY-like chemotaxis protein
MDMTLPREAMPLVEAPPQPAVVRPRHKALIVEDDDALSSLLAVELTENGYKTVVAGTVGEAWRAMLAEPPDVAVVDIRLPGVFGWELVERIRSDNRFRDLPVLITTGMSGTQEVERATALRCGFQMKPFDTPTLIEKMKHLMQAVRKIELRKVRVKIFLDSLEVEGNVHVEPEIGRFSDAWEALMRDDRSFIPITEASVRALNGIDPLASEVPFMEIRKVQLRAVFPMESDDVWRQT